MSRVARLGAFIVATLAVLAAGVFVIGSKQYLFGSTYPLRAQFANVAGLAAGADVQVGGVHSGTVRAIELPHKPGGRVTVLLDMDQSTREIIKQDSIATIETEGVLGNQYVALSFGSAGQADVKNGQLMQTVPALQVSDLLKKANGLLDSSQQAIQNTTMATAHLNSVTAKIDDGRGTAGALVNDRELYNNLAQTTLVLKATMIQAQAGVTDFQENMEALKHNFLLSGYCKKRGYEDSADITAHEIAGLPKGAAAKSYSFTVKQLFDKRDSAKLKNEKALNEAGAYLADNSFGVAVVVASTDMEGATDQDLVLSEARAAVVRQYLVEHYGFDDSQLKTQGLGKQSGSPAEADWGTIRILVFPVGTEMPVEKKLPVESHSKIGSSNPVPVAAEQKRAP